MKILIIGGNRFFGKRLTKKLIESGHDITLLNRGNFNEGFGNRIKRLRCDRTNHEALTNTLNSTSWDLVYDQVCFTANEAKSAVEIFKDKTDHYIFTSTQSVYGPAKDIKEEDFNPREHHFTEMADRHQNYSEAKRQSEAEFFKGDQLSLTAVRFPIVLGSDDPTMRFQFHIERIQKGEPIYFPNLDAKMSLISSDDAASVLSFLANKKLKGPVNASIPTPISLRELVTKIEKATGGTANLALAPSKEIHSPYGIENDWFMDVEKLKSLGFTCSNIDQWLPREIKTLTR